jgi:hypothetical protein
VNKILDFLIKLRDFILDEKTSRVFNFLKKKLSKATEVRTDRFWLNSKPCLTIMHRLHTFSGWLFLIYAASLMIMCGFCADNFNIRQTVFMMVVAVYVVMLGQYSRAEGLRTQIRLRKGTKVVSTEIQ